MRCVKFSDAVKRGSEKSLPPGLCKEQCNRIGVCVCVCERDGVAMDYLSISLQSAGLPQLVCVSR